MIYKAIEKTESKGFRQIGESLWRKDNWILYIDEKCIEIYEDNVDIHHNAYFYGKLDELDDVLEDITTLIF